MDRSAAPLGDRCVYQASREKSLHNDVIARFTISGVDHRFRKSRSVRFTDAGISPYDQNNRVAAIRLSLSLAVLEEALSLALWLPCVTSRQPASEPVLQPLDGVGAIAA